MAKAALACTQSLCLTRRAFEHCVEDTGGLFDRLAPHNSEGSCVEIPTRPAYKRFPPRRSDLYIRGERHFVVAVQRMDDRTVDAVLLADVVVQAEQLEVVHPEQLMAGHHWIDQRSQHIEKRPHAQRPPHAAHALERRAEKRRVEVAHPASVETAAQAVDVVGKTHPVRFEDIGSPTDRTGSIVAVLDHAVSRPGHHETRRSRYVERIFPVAARADDVDGLRSV